MTDDTTTDTDDAPPGPHDDDFCVVCNRGPSPDGPAMHPVKTIDNGYVCGDCIINAAQYLPYASRGGD